MLILIPAAGASSRMRGRDKLLEQVDNRPLLSRQVAVALQSGAEVLVTLPPGNDARRRITDIVEDERLSVMPVPDAAEGMAASIRAAVDHAYVRGIDALMILLADMPEIEAEDLNKLMNAFDGHRVVRASNAEGQPGHPVIFPARLFPALGALSGDQGARAVLSGEEVVTIPLPGYRATTDLDTPEDWAAWRRRTGR